MAVEALARWGELLDELAGLGEALTAAIEAADVAGAVAAMMPLRAVRAALARVEVTAPRGDAAEAAALRALLPRVARARYAEEAMRCWLARPLPGDAQLLASPLGAAVLADSILPPVWDFEVDLVVLVGDGLAQVATVLGDLGQRRVIVVGGDPAASAGLPAGALAVASPAELATAVRTLTPLPPTQLVVRAALGVDPEVAAGATAAAREALSDLRVHRNTVQAFSRTWIEQGAANLGALARWPSVAALDGAFAGVPMVIVAPGPSLARNVDQLGALAGRAILAVFSHSLAPVTAAGVTPDLVITVDPQDVRYHFAGQPLAGTCLVSAATAHPALFELPAPRMLTLSANSAIDDWLFGALGDDALVPGGGSVATTALSLALRWRCDPIVFLGLDLSFPGGAYYVATSSDGAARAEVDAGGKVRVVGWSPGFRAMKASGGPGAAPERPVALPAWPGTSDATVPSSFMFSLFHRWFVDRLRGLTAATVYNCTEGGAAVPGMIHAPLAEVAPRIASGPRVSVGAAIDDAIARLPVAARRARLAAHVASYQRGLRRAGLLGARAQALIARGEAGPQLERVERALAAALRPLGFAALLAQRDVERAEDAARREGTAADYLAATSRLLAAIARVIAELEPVLSRAAAGLQ